MWISVAESMSMWKEERESDGDMACVTTILRNGTIQLVINIYKELCTDHLVLVISFKKYK